MRQSEIIAQALEKAAQRVERAADHLKSATTNAARFNAETALLFCHAARDAATIADAIGEEIDAEATAQKIADEMERAEAARWWTVEATQSSYCGKIPHSSATAARREAVRGWRRKKTIDKNHEARDLLTVAAIAHFAAPHHGSTHNTPALWDSPPAWSYSDILTEITEQEKQEAREAAEQMTTTRQDILQDEHGNTPHPYRTR